MGINNLAALACDRNNRINRNDIYIVFLIIIGK